MVNFSSKIRLTLVCVSCISLLLMWSFIGSNPYSTVGYSRHGDRNLYMSQVGRTDAQQTKTDANGATDPTPLPTKAPNAQKNQMPTSRAATKVPTARPTPAPTSRAKEDPIAASAASSAAQSVGPTNATNTLRTSRRLCPVGDNEEYSRGRWVRNTSLGFPYTVGNIPVLDDMQPLCSARNLEHLRNGTVPDYLQYQWQPNSCDLAEFDRETFCRLLDGKQIGVVGDSLNEQLARSFQGLMFGDLETFWPKSPYRYSINLCAALNTTKRYTVTLQYRRINNYKNGTLKQLNELDYLIMNFGPHYRPRESKINDTLGLIHHLEEHWDKNPERIFWRYSNAAHEKCVNATGGPVDPTDTGHVNQSLISSNRNFFAHEILAQDEDIVKPLFKNRTSPLRNITFLNTGISTMLRVDGHRVKGTMRSNGRLAKFDCLHYCHPGPTDHWVEFFYHHVVMGI